MGVEWELFLEGRPVSEMSWVPVENLCESNGKRDGYCVWRVGAGEGRHGDLECRPEEFRVWEKRGWLRRRAI